VSVLALSQGKDSRRPFFKPVKNEPALLMTICRDTAQRFASVERIGFFEIARTITRVGEEGE